MKQLAIEQTGGSRSVYRIGPDNPHLGREVHARWLKPWGGKPVGFWVSGILESTFCVNGRTLIGEVRQADGRKVTCPWSKHYLEVVVS